MNSEGVERRLAAILSADVVGYSRLMAEDEAATVRTLGDYREEIGLLVRQHRGRVVDTAGDSLLAEFPTATDAVSCAVAIQGSLGGRNAALTPERRMEFRIGIHLGEVRVEGERIYGDGVNIAARLEGLAEAGGVCISATVHDQIKSKLDLGFEDLGEQLLKNIPDAVRVYRIQPRSGPEESARPLAEKSERPGRLRAALVATAAVLLLIGVGLWATWPRPLGLLIDIAGVSGPPVDPPLPDKPSIVVLPFTNMSGDPEQEYFSDGITEDLTNELARYPYLFVIARNSAFTYKGKQVNIEDVGRELGVRYVLEGSVRKAEDRVRITAQLIDSTSGGHLWSERYDRDLSDIFVLQSEIAEEILAAVSGEIFRVEEQRLARRPTTSLSAWEAYLKGGLYLDRATPEDNQAARSFLAHALELDPEFAPAHAVLGHIYWQEYSMGWNRDPVLLDRAEELGRRAITLDPTYFQGYMTVGWVEFWRGNLPEALAASERAIELAPTHDVPHALRAMILAREGRLVEAMGSIRRALRLSPRAPHSAVLASVAYVNLAAGRRQEAVELFERARAVAPGALTVRIPLAALYEEEGAHEKAQAVVAEILRVTPDLTAERAMDLIQGLDQILSPEELARYPDYLRKAGLPEQVPATQDFTVPGFGEAPAIAVLPFDNLSGDPEQEYFADGIAEDLINRLSSWGVFPVIARNSSFTYRGKAVDVKQVSRELGVRYVVEGSVRRAAERVRITAQLIDATSGHHVWTETYDRELQDIFALQDEITRAIGASMGAGLWEAEEKRTARRSTQSVDSYDYTMRGFWHIPARTKEENLQARMLFQRAAELDPRSALALAGLAFTHSSDILYQWSDSPPHSVTELERSARGCISVDNRLPICQQAMCYAHWLRGQTAKAIAACELAVQLNPSLSIAYSVLGATLTIAGRSDEGVEKLETAIRLSPHDSLKWTFFQSMSMAHLGADRYQEAADWAQRSLQLKPDDHNTHALLAISYAHLGRFDEARAEFREVLRLQPDYSLAGVEQVFAGADPGFLERVIDGLRKAGLKE